MPFAPGAARGRLRRRGWRDLHLAVGRHQGNRPTRSRAGCSSSACAAGSPATPTHRASSWRLRRLARNQGHRQHRGPRQLPQRGAPGRHAAQRARARRQATPPRRRGRVGARRSMSIGVSGPRSPIRASTTCCSRPCRPRDPMGPLELRQIQALYAPTTCSPGCRPSHPPSAS